jgi:hypothetical protein
MNRNMLTFNKEKADKDSKTTDKELGWRNRILRPRIRES